MWNGNRIALDANLRSRQSGVLEATTDKGHPQTLASREDRPELLTENRSSSVAEEDVASAYATLLADQAAYRTRLQRESARVIEAEKASLAQALLDSTDDLEHALEAADVSGVRDRGLLNLMDGVRLSLAVLYKRIGEMGAERMSTIGQLFDPACAEAVGTVSVTDPAQHGIVIQELRPGYRVGDRLLRPARVRVGQSTRKYL
jgi:molecular chaperone GrpE